MKYIILVVTFLFNILTVHADDMCYETYTFKAESIINTFLVYFRVIIPIALVILIMFDMISVITSNDKDALDKKIKTSLKRMLVAVIMFLAPSILISLSTNILGTNVFKNSTVCLIKEEVNQPEVATIYDPYHNQVYPDDAVSDSPSDEPSSSSNGCNSGTYTTGSGGDHYKKTITMNCRTYKVYNQFSYSGVKFLNGKATLSKNGCSVVSLAIAMSAYDPSITPLTIKNYYRFKSLSVEAASALGYKLVDVSKNENAISSYVDQGIPVIFLEGLSKSKAYPKNKYATFRHYIVILGETKDGKLIFGNSTNTATTGTYDEILHKYSNYGFWAVVKS